LMGEIASDIALGMHEDKKELEHFTLYRLCDMIREFRAKYRADLNVGS
jgi:hypothetical protein